ncbi:hypothetical protein L6R52_42175, partial [Myxococcota bacterium]|nr:hypothetical protein [Myxococcota bacterium]
MKPTIDLLDRRDDGHLAAHVLERLAFEGRLAASDGPRADALRSAEAHVEACAACRDAIAALRADHAAFLARRPVDGFFTELARVDGPAPVPL